MFILRLISALMLLMKFWHSNLIVLIKKKLFETSKEGLNSFYTLTDWPIYKI